MDLPVVFGRGGCTRQRFRKVGIDLIPVIKISLKLIISEVWRKLWG